MRGKTVAGEGLYPQHTHRLLLCSKSYLPIKLLSILTSELWVYQMHYIANGKENTYYRVKQKWLDKIGNKADTCR